MNGYSYFLTGFMGAGKTTVARLLSLRLGLPWHDLDLVIQKQSGMAIREIFDKRGEAYFRVLEKNTLEELPLPAVISLGGGAFIQPAVREYIGVMGISIYLELPFSQVWERVRGKKRRPLVSHFGELSRLMEQRRFFYSSADLVYPITDLENSKAVVNSIHEILRGRQ